MYLQKDYSGNPYHPNHKTGNELQITALRRRIKRVKTAKKKQQLRDAIKALQ